MASRSHARRSSWASRLLLPAVLLAVAALALAVGWRALGQERAAAATADGAAVVPPPEPAASPVEPPASPAAAPSATRAPSSPTASAPASPSARATTAAPRPTSSPTARASASASAASPSASVPAPRSYPVVVYNATSRTGAARALADDLQADGWRIAEVGNWTERPPSTTVYHPVGAAAAGRALARAVGADRVREAYAALPDGRLVVVIG